MMEMMYYKKLNVYSAQISIINDYYTIVWKIWKCSVIIFYAVALYILNLVSSSQA